MQSQQNCLLCLFCHHRPCSDHPLPGLLIYSLRPWPSSYLELSPTCFFLQNQRNSPLKVHCKRLLPCPAPAPPSPSSFVAVQSGTFGSHGLCTVPLLQPGPNFQEISLPGALYKPGTSVSLAQANLIHLNIQHQLSNFLPLALGGISKSTDEHWGAFPLRSYHQANPPAGQHHWTQQWGWKRALFSSQQVASPCLPRGRSSYLHRQPDL